MGRFLFSRDPNNTPIVREGHTLTWQAASAPPRVVSQVGSLPSQPQGRPEDAVASRGYRFAWDTGARNCSSSPKEQRPFWPLNPALPAHFLRRRQHVGWPCPVGV